MVKLNREQIQEILPHRDPFLLVDEVTMLDMETMRVEGIKYVTGEEYFFKGHFPGYPVMPGVLVLEALAQNGAVCILNKEDFKGKIAFFGRANNVKFKGMVKPGDKLELSTQMVNMKAGVAICEASAKVDGKIVCTAEIVCAVK